MKLQKRNVIHGSVIILMGLTIIVWGPINFRGVPLNPSVGVVVCLFGIGFILIDLEGSLAISQIMANRDPRASQLGWVEERNPTNRLPAVTVPAVHKYPQ